MPTTLLPSHGMRDPRKAVWPMVLGQEVGVGLGLALLLSRRRMDVIGRPGAAGNF